MGRGAKMKRIVLTCVVVAFFAFASAALGAGGSTLQQAYGGEQNIVAGTPTKPSANAPSGTLPFTGVDLAFFAGAGLLLTGAGLALRRPDRKKD